MIGLLEEEVEDEGPPKSRKGQVAKYVKVGEQETSVSTNLVKEPTVG